MRIAITGSTGLIGSKLISFFAKDNHQVAQITRSPLYNEKYPTTVIQWDPDKGLLDASLLEGFDVVIHLAGTNVGDRWTTEHKKSILESRLKGTRLLSQVLARLKNKPKVFLSASAVGYYGNHVPDVVLDESSPAGQGFLADVCKVWEEETQPAKDAGIRVIHTRFGVVLSKSGGALAKMWVPFQIGVGGVLGHGQQMMSWVALDEIPSVMMYVIGNENISGPINVVGPKAVSNREFTKALGRVIKRPVIFPVPAPMIKLMFGEMGKEMLLEGNHVVPKRLLESGYQFKYPDIQSALEAACKK